MLRGTRIGTTIRQDLWSNYFDNVCIYGQEYEVNLDIFTSADDIANYEYTTKDLVILAKHISGRETIKAATIANWREVPANIYDVNGDGKINSDDLLMMIKLLTGEFE